MRRLRPLAAARLAAAGPLAAGLLAAACRPNAESRPAAGRPSGDARAAADTAPGPDSLALRAAADSGRIQGAPGARVWLIMVSDFQCPYCKQWHDESYAALAREYVASGRARAAFVNFPLSMHRQAVPAAEAAMCASAQGKFWPYQTALFDTQARWAAMSDATPLYDSLATAVGADAAKFRRCTRSHVMRAVVDADLDRMERAGVRSTPSFFVGSTPIAGAQPTATFRQALDAQLAQ